MKFREDLEGRLARQGLVVLKFQLFELRLPHHLPLFILYRGFKKAGNKGLGHLAPNILTEMPPHQRGRSMTGAKTRKARALGELRHH